jgi:hypothetical protein
MWKKVGQSWAGILIYRHEKGVGHVTFDFFRF